MDSSPPHRAPEAGGPDYVAVSAEFGVPSRELRERGAEGWARFLDRVFGEPGGEEGEG